MKIKIISLILLLLSLTSVLANTNQLLPFTKADSLKSQLELTPDSLKIDLLQNIYLEYYFQEDFLNSIIYANKLLNKTALISDSLVKENKVSFAYQILGKSYYSMNLLSTALEYSSKALIINKRSNNIPEIIVTLLDMGNIYSDLGNDRFARKYYDEVIVYCKKVEDEYSMSLAYNNIGILQSNVLNYDSALYYYKKSLKIKKEINGFGDVITYSNISDNYRDMNMLDSSRKYLGLAMSLINNKESFLMQAVNYHNYALIYLKENQLEKARAYIFKSLKITIPKKFNSQILDSYKVLSEIYEKQNNFIEALKYHKKYAKLNDSLKTANQNVQISLVELLFVSENQQLKIDKLKVEDELKNVKIIGFQNKQIVLIIGLILLLLIAIIFFIQKSRIKQAYRRIVDENVKMSDLRLEIKALKKLQQKTKSSVSQGTSQIKLDDVKYSDSSLSDEQKRSIADKITKAIDEDKLFLDEDFRLDSLVTEIEVNKTYISQVLNEILDTTFSEIVNLYRIEEAKSLLIDDENKNLTIEAIAQKAGFKSSSTFNRVFKNETGVTPSFFLKNVRKK